MRSSHEDVTPSESSADVLRTVEEIGGFVPNSFYEMSRNPNLLRIVTDLCLEVLPPEDGKVSLELKWLVAHIVSRSAGCKYCWAHTASNASRIAGITDEKLDAAWSFQTSNLFSSSERAAMDVALAAGFSPSQVTEGHLKELRRYFDRDQVIEIVSVICLFGWFNRWNDIMGTELEEMPLAYAQRRLTGSGWDPGRHVTGQSH